MGKRGPTKEFPHRVPIYLDGAGVEKLDALPGKSRSQKVRDLIDAEYARKERSDSFGQEWLTLVNRNMTA